MSNVQPAKGSVGYLMEVGALKRAKRAGWWIAGVKDPETIAEHSFRTAVVGSVLALMEGADPAKVALLCTFHDTQETRVGDIPWIGRRYITAASNEDVTADQLADAHPAVASGIARIVEEYEHGNSIEVSIARDADKLECMLQGLEYLEQGYRNAQEWVDSTRAKLKTSSAIELADAAQTMSSAEWQRTYLRWAEPRPDVLLFARAAVVSRAHHPLGPCGRRTLGLTKPPRPTSRRAGRFGVRIAGEWARGRRR